MFKTIYIRELQNCIYSLRFRMSSLIVLSVFIIGTITFLVTLTEEKKNYSQLEQAALTELSERSRNISNVATKDQQFIMTPRENAIIADGKENIIPNLFTYSAYSVKEFHVRHESVNPLIKSSEKLNWGFIVSMFMSFVTLLLAFDSISGEKEDKTLALVFSNRVPRRTFLLAKGSSIVSIVSLMLLVGMMTSLLIIILSGAVAVDAVFLGEAVLFFLFSLFFIALFAAFGLLSSAITPHSNISLLTSLCFWLFAVVVIPNSSIFWAKKLFPIPTADTVTQAFREEVSDLSRNAPPGSWSSSDNDPFMKRHELRADLQMKIMNTDKRISHHYYMQMFDQFEKTRRLTLVSPIAQYDYINEAILGGGYLRFRKNWDDLHKFQEQFLQWFKDMDAKDEKSPHWYNPYEDYSTSKKRIEVDLIPRYQEQIAPFGERFGFITGYLAVMACMIVILFGLAFFFFIRYDVR